MVTSSIARRFRSCATPIGGLALLLLVHAGQVAAASAQLAPGLEVSLPEPLVAYFIETSEADLGPVLIGEIDGQPGFFMAAVGVASWERNNILWEKLESEIRQRSDDGEVSFGQKGSFRTRAGDNVWYRLYEYQAADQKHRQIYYLLKGEITAYWITVTMADGISPELALPLVQVLLNRARLAQ